MKLFAISILAFACVSAHANGKPPLIVMMGGWYSCGKAGAPMPPVGGMLWSDHAGCHVKDAWPRPHDGPTTIYSCYTGDTNVEKAEFRFAPHGEKPTVLKTGSPLDVIKRFADYVKAQAGDREILFIGHSHGGWSAMRAALHFPPEKASFVAMDPVSRIGCPPDGFFKSVSVRHRTIDIPPDCGAFPSDIDLEMRRQLFRSGRKVAVNFFAGGKGGGSPRVLPYSGFAVSGEGSSALNHRIEEPKIDPSDVRDAPLAGNDYDPSRFLAHQALSRDPRTWATIREKVEQGYGVKLDACGRYGGPAPSLKDQGKKLVAKAALAVPRMTLPFPSHLPTLPSNPFRRK